MSKRRVLFLCTHNSARSQMAEGFLRSMASDYFEVASPWDYVITVCDAANEACPVFPRKTSRLHWSFRDPSRATGMEEERLEVFRQVRDQIKTRISEWLGGSVARDAGYSSPSDSSASIAEI